LGLVANDIAPQSPHSNGEILAILPRVADGAGVVVVEINRLVAVEGCHIFATAIAARFCGRTAVQVTCVDNVAATVSVVFNRAYSTPSEEGASLTHRLQKKILGVQLLMVPGNSSTNQSWISGSSTSSAGGVSVSVGESKGVSSAVKIAVVDRATVLITVTGER
jgi:hypothetical protein